MGLGILLAQMAPCEPLNWPTAVLMILLMAPFPVEHMFFGYLDTSLSSGKSITVDTMQTRTAFTDRKGILSLHVSYRIKLAGPFESD